MLEINRSRNKKISVQSKVNTTTSTWTQVSPLFDNPLVLYLIIPWNSMDCFTDTTPFFILVLMVVHINPTEKHVALEPWIERIHVHRIFVLNRTETCRIVATTRCVFFTVKWYMSLSFDKKRQEDF